MDRRTLVAVALCFAIFMAWQKLYIEPRLPKSTANQVQQNQQQPTETGAPVSSAPSAPSLPPSTSPPLQTSTLKTSVSDATVSSGPDFFTNWSLKGYRLGLSADAAAVHLRAVTNEEGEIGVAFDQDQYAYLHHVSGKLQSTPTGATWSYEDQNVKMTREFIATDGQPYVDMKISAEFKGKHPDLVYAMVSSRSFEKDPEANDRKLLYYTNESLESVPLKDSMDPKNIPSNTKYVAAANRYFVLALVSTGPLDPKALVQQLAPKEARASLVFPVTGNSFTIPFRVYFGPKEIDVLKQVDPTLTHTVDFGWVNLFAFPILKLLKWLYAIVKNYGVAIIILTILLKLVTYPLTAKSMKNAKEMQKIQPQLARLKEKYKDDRNKLNQETMLVMKTAKVNPVAGCLPVAIQIPVFMALWRVLYGAIELYHTPFAFWIQDMSSRDPFYIMPVLVTAVMFLQQKLSPQTAVDPTQQKMLQMMPIMFGAFLITTPAGLTLYMFVNALASIIQQLYLNKKFGLRNATPVAAPAR
ncbi:MAG: membrane protein insertase YidC [Bdellovibrionota bacterium]